ncbi:ChaB family protein [Komagataeibacter rhaeticus]|uniref:ChaB family protein n=1 Tax=Komagataeibacter rhaeticus TaxID=215221 RepID=UPI00248FEF65|nr:ChaB family protein [Komagataeibacter rhaeticus]
MPYASLDDLPDRIRLHLPTHAQKIFRAAFNNAWTEYGAKGEAPEKAANRVVWAAVKRKYIKVGDVWVERDDP